MNNSKEASFQTWSSENATELMKESTMAIQRIASFRLPNSWKTRSKKWSHPLHSICSRTGAFPPTLARYYILKFSGVGEVVLDQFSGKGTAPLEACIFGRKGIGNDASPEAYVLTKSKVRAPTLSSVDSRLGDLEKVLRDEDPTDAIPQAVSQFFHPDTLKQILRLKEAISNQDDDISTFIKALAIGILHGSSDISLSIPCMHSFSMSPNYVGKYIRIHNLVAPRRNVIQCLRIKAQRVLADFAPMIKGKATRSDARHINLPGNSVNLIVTSPPYFNKQTYAWDNWLRLWFLGFPDHRQVAKRLFSTSSTGNYLNFSKEWLSEAYRVLRPTSACIVVVGDVRLDGEIINTAELLVETAEGLGFSVPKIVKDSFANHIGFTHLFHSNNDDNETFSRPGRTIDRILELHKGDFSEKQISINWLGKDENSAIVPSISRYLS